MGFDANQYKTNYRRDNYDILRAFVPKGKADILKEEASVRGISVSQLIVRALEHCYKLDLSKD